MYRFTRTATVSNAVHTPKAVGYAMEICGYVNKTYSINLRCGLEMFGGLNIHWQWESDSLDKITAINAKLFEDKMYWSMLEKGKELFISGSMKDTVVNFPVY